MSYIEREAANALLLEECSPKVAAYLIDAVAAIPAADVRPVKPGKWEDVEVTDVRNRDAIGISSIASMRCSDCHRYHNEVYFYGEPTEFAHFCPYCGAYMMEES